MSGENFAGSGPGAPDRYAYSGDAGVTGANGAPGHNPNDRGDGQGQAGTNGGSSDCNWRPDYSYSSPHARAWLAASKEQANQPINRDASGMYTVQFGDSLSGIAARELHDEGQTIDRSKINDEVGRIVKANDQHYQSLDCNKDLVKVGWQLQIPRWSPRLPDQETGNQPGDQGNDQGNGDGHPRCVHRDQGRNYYDQSNQPRQMIFNIQNAYFDMSGRGGFSMQPGGSRGGDMRQYSGGDQYDIPLPNQGDQYNVAPRYNTSIPPAGLDNGYGWNNPNNWNNGNNWNNSYDWNNNGGVYFTQPQGWGYDNGSYWPGQQVPNIYLGLDFLGRGHRPPYFQPPNRNWNWQNGQNYSGGNNWHNFNNTTTNTTIYNNEYTGQNGQNGRTYSGSNGYTGQHGRTYSGTTGSNGSTEGYTGQNGRTYSGTINGSNEGATIQTVPYNPNSGHHHMRTLVYHPSEGYQVTPIRYENSNNT